MSLFVCVIALSLTAVVTSAQAQTFSVIHNFTNGTDGGNPLSGFTMDAKGNLYGTTNAGGTYGYGLVFKMGPSGTVTPLYNFTGLKDGGAPIGNLILDAAGALYGTTTTAGHSQQRSGVQGDWQAGNRTVQLRGWEGRSESAGRVDV